MKKIETVHRIRALAILIDWYDNNRIPEKKEINHIKWVIKNNNKYV